MNFFGQMGAFFLALMFGKIADEHIISTILFLLVCICNAHGCILWLAIDPTRQVDYLK